MGTLTTTASARSSWSIRAYLAGHPLAGFFALAYAGAWLAFLPPLLAQNGLGLVPVRLPLVLFLALGSFTGPALAAILVSGAAGGRAGVRALFRRYTITPTRYWWYLLALFGPAEALLVASSVTLGSAPLDALRRQPLLFLIAYLGSVIGGLLVGPLGEELGWRGFALPRLQQAVGPLAASLILGVLWASWHLPVFFFPEWRGTAGVLPVAVGFYSWVIPFTVIMTWVYNSAHGSLLVATLFHAAENAAALVIPALLVVPADLFLQTKVYGVLAVLLVVLTRGKLSVASFREPSDGAAATPGPGRRPLTRQRIVIGLVVGLIALYFLANIGYDLIHGAK